MKAMIDSFSIKKKTFYLLCLFMIVLSFYSCKKELKDVPENKLFTSVSSNLTGITFKNEIVESEDFYYYKYIYSYNGGGVATADFNNDGYEDLFFVSNLGESKLYSNAGNFNFTDQTKSSGIIIEPGFSTGVSVVDINSDGLLDIYVSRAGWFSDAKTCTNQLFINKDNFTFEEQAKAYGLADSNKSIQATFFDFDKDGDLDVYIVNAPYSNKRMEDLVDLKTIKNDSTTKALGGSDSFYENLGNNKFVNISEKAGIVPDIAFGLNAQVGDLNNDGWLDVYVNNDFNMPDFAYINNQDGTFTDKREEMFKHQSFYSMGGDIADINNDGLLDMVVLDMNPEDYVRSKTTMSMMSIDKFNTMVNNGYHYQYMHNVLQLNNGNQTFSEIGNMSGIANTDWSWASLFADFDLDGYNDLYITNGVFRDVIDKDVSNTILELIKQKGKKPTSKEYLEYTKMLPQQKLTNYFFKNEGDLTFSNKSETWSTEKPTFSNGAVYTDLDNDGDLDIVINNINDEATILKNNAVESYRGQFLELELKGSGANHFAIGSTVKIYTSDHQVQTRQLINSRGYLSSVGNKVHFGFDSGQSIDKIEIIWPDGHVQQLENVKANQLIKISYLESEHSLTEIAQLEDHKLFEQDTFNFVHTDSIFNDFNIQVLLPHKLSQLGPAVAKGDVNNDGIEDVYLGGAYMLPGQLIVGTPSGSFEQLPNPAFVSDAIYEDIGATFFDLENDGDLDLYVVSGSYEFYEDSPFYRDRIYINDGQGKYETCVKCIPEFYSSGSVVVAADYDNDGDTDLFVGGRLVPGKYPHPPSSHLLINEGGIYKIRTFQLAKELEKTGMVTDAKWADIDQDKDLDLIVTGEWMGIEVFENENGNLNRNNKYKTLSDAKGWWNKIIIEDIDNDGDLDIVAGNLGLNYKFHATKEKPFEVYTKDFDFNGTEDIFLAKYYNGKQVPIRGKGCSTQQIPDLANKIKTYQDFANRDMEGILGTQINTALHYSVTEFRSGIFTNNDNGKFNFSPFINEAQISPINSILYQDFDGDGLNDLLMAGNNYQSEVETTRADAGIGVYLKGNGNGQFNYMDNRVTGFYTDKDVRNMILLNTENKPSVLIINNNDKLDLYRYHINF